MGIFEKPEALEGIRVLELATRIFGPATTDFLGELGATVIKVELPGIGDLMRYVAPDGDYWQNLSPAFPSQNHNKYHVAIDVRKGEGKELFLRLAERSDVILENVRPGTMDRWGLGYLQVRERNPRIIYAANTGFGQWGKFSVGIPSYDATAQAMSGLSSITGFPGRPPLKLGIWIGDYTGALLSAMAIMAALNYRERSGRGQFIDVSQAESLIRTMDWTWAFVSLTGEDRGREGNRDPLFPPTGIYPCRDGLVAVGYSTGEGRKALYEWLGLDEGVDPSVAQRRLEEKLADLSREEVERDAASWGFSASVVMDAGHQYHSLRLRERRAIWSLDDPLYGEVVDYGPAPKMEHTPPRMKWFPRPVGFHNELVLKGVLGLTEEEIKTLEETGVIGGWLERPGAMPPDGWDGDRENF